MSTRARVLLAFTVGLVILGFVAIGLIQRAHFGNTDPVCEVAGASYQLDPEQAGNAATITSVAVRRGLPGRAVTIALATALQESKLYNLDYGDQDSVGLFQQRSSQGWGPEDKLQDPVYATEKFYDALLKIPDWQTKPLTKVAQLVQRSAYPDAYAQWESTAEPLARALLGHAPAALSCHYPKPKTAADAGQVFTALAAQLPAQKAADGNIAVTNSSQGWMLASWLTANGQQLKLRSVSYAGKTWTYDDTTWKADSNAPSSRIVLGLS